MVLDIASRAGWRVNHYTDAATGTMAQDAEGRLVVTMCSCARHGV